MWSESEREDTRANSWHDWMFFSCVHTVCDRDDNDNEISYTYNLHTQTQAEQKVKRKKQWNIKKS